MNGVPKTTEQYISHIPALHTLAAAGWTFMSAEECLSARGSNREVLLPNMLVEVLRKRRFEYRGGEYPLSTNAIEQIVRELSDASLHEGLVSSNERFYDKLCLGVTVTEFIDGKKHSPTIPIIDWKNPESNSFIVTEELEVLRTGGDRTRRPDVVCYVNGIPLAVVEAKRPDSGNPSKSMIDEGISQHLRNQGRDEIPHLFVYSQLLLSVDGTDGRYATTATPAKFWARWREEEFDEDRFSEIKNTPLSDETKDSIFANRPAETRKHFDKLWSEGQSPTDQDRLIVSLLSPRRLLEFVRGYVLFDNRKGKGKIAARYQQFFGVRSLVSAIEKGRGGKEPRGGVVWHTTGSGKSLTMIFLCKALLLHPTLADSRFVVVTDRIDLEKQLARTFLAGGAFGSATAGSKVAARAKASSGKNLARRIGAGNERIVFSIVDKFATASKLPECRNESENIVVLVDEGHRSHEGETHQRMRRALPNACYVAFTGTPLLKEEKTEKRFGPIVHAYTMRRAVEDGAVTPLLYEERVPELNVDEAAVDEWFEQITADLSETQKTDITTRWERAGVYGSAGRIRLIAWDIAVHFSENFKKLGRGLKGQVATRNRTSAIRYKKYLDETGLVTSEVVISPPDTREGHSEVDEVSEIQEWWEKNVRGNPRDREREVIDRFGTGGPPDLLIVVDKLLTGFDEPRNAVLYIDKPLKDHAVIQAVARVNRLHEEKTHGLLVDYRGILKELDASIGEYRNLADRTQCGYDVDDLEGLYGRVDAEYKRLPVLRDRLLEIFSPVRDGAGVEEYRRVLVPRHEEDAEGGSYDARRKTREDFYAALTEFGMCLKTALASRSFFEDRCFPESLIETYKRELRFFTVLRQIARRDAGETDYDYGAYEAQIRKLVDERIEGCIVHASEIRVPVGELGGGGDDEDPEEWSEQKTRNETEIIRSRIERTIGEMEDDPYAREVFSELLKKAIEEAEGKFGLQLYLPFRELEKKVVARDVETVPGDLADNLRARACYGVFRLVLGEDRFESLDEGELEEIVRECFHVDEVVRDAVSAHSLNPQGMEKEIRKTLLPRLFGIVGLADAKKIIERVIHIARVNRSRGAF